MATTTQLGDIVREVGGPVVEVTQLLAPSTDPHDYEPRPRDVEAASGAALVVLSGDGLDAWADGVVVNAGGDPDVLDAGAGRPVVRAGDGDGRVRDPHWWHDPRNVVYAVDRIRDALIALRPADAARLRRSAATYAARVRRMDEAIGRCLARVPAGERTLVTDHDAFGYLAGRYGIRVVGAVLPSQSTQAQPSAGDLADLAGLVRRERVAAVFPESSLNPALVRALARRTGARVQDALYGDTLGPAGSRGATYVGMEEANADTLARGFTGGRLGCPAA